MAGRKKNPRPQKTEGGAPDVETHNVFAARRGAARLERADLNHLAGPNGEESLGAGRHEWQQILHAIGFCK